VVMAERVPNQRRTARPDEKLSFRKRRADPPEKCQWHDVTSLIKASDHGGVGWMLHSFAGRTSASIRPPFPAVAGQGMRVGHSHHIPVTPEIELIHLSDVPI